MTVLAAVLLGSLFAHADTPTAVFQISLSADRSPIVAGGEMRVAIDTRIQDGWHINSDNPGDEFSVPTTIEWNLPEAWSGPQVEFATADEAEFDFSETPLRVWEGHVTHIATFKVPQNASGDATIVATMTAQACNNTQCLPPMPVRSALQFVVSPEGTPTQIEKNWPPGMESVTADTRGEQGPLKNTPHSGDTPLPLFLLGVFLAGLALNLTPCVFPLIPITMGFFSQSAKSRRGGTFWMALAYVFGIALTYSSLGVFAALTGQLFGSYLQNPWVIALIVLVLLGLATSMFGLWEFRAPNWANRAAGAGSGPTGALLMGLVMGFVAAPCIGPFVLGLLTLVGQKGDPVFGFFSFFTLALGLGLPYLILGTFTGFINKLPMSGAWMVGIRKIFGIILVAMAAYFAAPLLPGDLGGWLIAGALLAGGAYLLIIDRSAVDRPGIDRMMRTLSLVMILIGVWLAPGLKSQPAENKLTWEHPTLETLQKSIENGDRIIVDFYADWCLPCRELDEKTFSDPRVMRILKDFERFKMDQTRQDESARQAKDAFGVRGVPTIIVFEGGKEVFRITGFEAPETFRKRLQRAQKDSGGL